MLAAVRTRVKNLRQHYLFQNLRSGIRLYMSDRITVVMFLAFIFIIFIAAFGPILAPYDPETRHRGEDGELLRMSSPTGNHWLGTTEQGKDVFSRLLIGARPTVVTGLSGGLIIVSIGLLIGVTAGYFGGSVDNVLMRFTDFAYGIPIIPTAIVVIALLGMGFWSTIFIIGALLWRGNARVFRSQVLQIKEREHVRAAEIGGASSVYIVLRHILPNMAGMIMLFLALGTGITILISASLAFLGFLNPFTPSWGIMIRNAYGSGFPLEAWWWTLPSGFAISFTVLVIFMLGRGYERVHNTDVNEMGA